MTPQLTQTETGGAGSRDPQTHSVRVGGVNVLLKSHRALNVDVSTAERDGFTLVHFDVRDQNVGPYEVVALQPFLDIEHSWAGMVHTWTGTEITSVALNLSFETAANRFIPVFCNYARDGSNRGLVGLADHKPLTRVNQAVVVEYPMRELKATFARNRPRGPLRETVVLGPQRDHYSDVVKGYMTLCKNLQRIQPMAAPDWVRDPVWCSWYSHVTRHTQMDVERELRAVKALGFRTVLVDAVWFGPYSFLDVQWLLNQAGDFQPNPAEWPDMAGFVRKVHELGMRAMLWCAPLWVGPESKAWARMQPYCVHDGKERIRRLCPHCPESIAHAREIVGRLMREYNLDGLKIDFMDHVDPVCVDPKHDHSQQDFGEAMDDFMAGTRDEILGANPHAVIEYRNRYSNLVTLAHANAQRGNDSPYDADYIRRQNVYVRFFCEGSSTVWSDYLYWHPDESPGNVFLRIGQMIFSGGVPTFSVAFSGASKVHQRITRKWLAFYRENKESLARATVRVHSADSCYSVHSLQDGADGCACVAFNGPYLPSRLALEPGVKTLWLLNASAQKAGRVEFVSGDDIRKITVKQNGLKRIAFER